MKPSTIKILAVSLCIAGFANADSGVGRLWIAKTFAHKLIQTDESGNILRTISVEAPYGVASDGQFLYVNLISGIERRTLDGTRVGSIPHTGPSGFDLAWDSRRSQLWLSEGWGRLAQVNSQTGAISRSIPYPEADLGSGLSSLMSLGLAYDPRRDRLYVSFCSSPNHGNCSYAADGRPSGVIMAFNAETGQNLGVVFRHRTIIFGLGYDPVSDSIWGAANDHGNNSVVKFGLDGGERASINPINWTYAEGVEFILSRQPPALVTSVALDKTYGPGTTCPASIKFSGTITTSAPGEVRYVFVRSDGAKSSEQVLRFTEAGSKKVQTDWTLARNIKAWVAVRVTSPETIESQPASFFVDACR